MVRKMKFIEFIQVLQRLLPNESDEFGKLLQAINDGHIEIDSQIKRFLAESCRCMRLLSGDIGVSDVGEVLDFSFILYKDNEQLVAIEYPLKDGRFEVNHITPGNYALNTSTGLLLWKKTLDQQDLLISKSSQKSGKLRMAADSGEGKSIASFTEKFANGEISLNVYAGFETGRIEITFNLPGNNEDE